MTKEPVPYMPCVHCGNTAFRFPLEHDKQGFLAVCTKCEGEVELYDANEELAVVTVHIPRCGYE